MLISGTRHRFIYPQDTVNWSFNLRPVSTGIFNFNFHSNSGDVFNIFYLKNEKIYSRNDHFIGNYSINSNLSLSGNVTNNRLDLYNNSTPLYLGLPINNFDKITGFSLNSVGGNNVNFLNLNIWGDRPEYFYDQTAVYRSGELIKINIVNNSNYNFTIFSGSSTNSNFLISGINNLNILKNNSGFFYLINNANFINFSNTNIILDTDFGRQDLRISLSGIRLEDEFYYLSLGPNILFIENDFYKDYNIVFRNRNSANLTIELKYISGVTGDYLKPVSRAGFLTNQNVSGFITGSGFLFGSISGLVSGFNSLRNSHEFGTGFGIARNFRIADDQFIENKYNILASGIGDVFSLTNISAQGKQNNILYSGFINLRGGVLTGFFSGFVTGIVPDAKRGWYVDSNGNFVPPPISEESYKTLCSLNPGNPICSQYSFIYEYETSLRTGIILKSFDYTGNIFIPFNASEYETVNLKSPTLFVTGLTTGFFNITGAALATGGRISGKLIGDYLLNFEPGNWFIYRNYSGLITGKSFIPLSGGVNFPFDPVKGEAILTQTTGTFNGIVSSGLTISFCEPTIPASLKIEEIPQFIRSDSCFKDDTIHYHQYSGFILQPRSGEQERFYENSVFQITSGNYQLYNGHPTGGRTRISRLGNTPSGSGFFYHLFEGPETGSLKGLPKEYNGGGWEETLVTLEPVALFDNDGIVPSITDINIASNLLYPCDPTIIYFTIDTPDFYLTNDLNITDCWSECFSNWPRKQYSVENSGSITFINSDNPEFSSDGSNYGLEFQICNTANLEEKIVRLLYLNPSIIPIIRSSIGDQISISNNNNYTGTYYINSVNYFSNFRDIRLGLSCVPVQRFLPCDTSFIGTKLWVYDEISNIADPNWCSIVSNTSS
jgi:hypothetical protein